MKTETLTLSDFLLARISEDEATALSASPGPWHLNAEHDEVLAVDDVAVCDGFALSGPQTRATTEHIARHDPARVLAECEAKRRIVELRYSWNLQAERMSEPPFGPILQTQVNTADAVLRSLALPYADHADYDETWRPY